MTEEFRNDRRPVASLMDDALRRSRLQAQKDGTVVMDSKWLEIVGCCHRTFSLSLFSLSVLSLSPISLFPIAKTHGTRCTSSKAESHGRTARVELGEVFAHFLCVQSSAHASAGSEVNRLPAQEKNVVHTAVISGLTLSWPLYFRRARFSSILTPLRVRSAFFSGLPSTTA